MVRGASRRTREKMACAAAVLVASATILGAVPTPGAAATPVFVPPNFSFALSDVGGSSTPALADIDGDGDLDAFLGSSGGDIHFFSNTGSASAPAFASSSLNPFGLANVGQRSSPELADIDGDGDLDAFIGNQDGNTYFFENTGSASAAAFAPPTVNPFGIAAVGSLSSPDIVDIDGDGDLDAFIGDGDGKTVFFENTGSASSAAFATSSANPFGVAAVGFGSHPALADIDGDGDLDVFIGDNYGDASFFANTGSASAPAFAPSSLNPFGLANVGLVNSPAFADIDGDGDLDAFLGDGNGDTRFFVNTGSASAPAFAPPAANPFGLANVGYISQPSFADIDGDGDLDAFIGTVGYSGILFFANTGSASAPAFAPPVADPFGPSSLSYSNPVAFADIDGDGDLDAFVGFGAGDTHFFENTGSPTAPAFAPSLANPFGLLRVSASNFPALADIDGDGDIDAFLGDNDGETFFFENVAGPPPPPGDACPPAPDTCTDGFARAVLLVKESSAGNEKIVVELVKGPSVLQAAFGDPVSLDGTAYSLCIYGDDDALVGELGVDRAGDDCDTKPCWKSLGKPTGTGFRYLDRQAAADGVKSLKLKGGAGRPSKLFFTAANSTNKGQSAMPTGIAAALEADTSATLQIRSSDATCFSEVLPNVKRAESDFFKARK